MGSRIKTNFSNIISEKINYLFTIHCKNQIIYTMKIFIAIVLTITTLTTRSQIKAPTTRNPGNTLAISANDTKENIISKAAQTVPTSNQYEALKNEFIAFIHFGPNTFTRMEWGNGKEDPKIFDLKELHTDQWCESIKSAGMKMVIITVKHHDGFVLWQSRYTKHGIMSANYKNGQGDILKDLSASCKKYGLKLGIYLSPADLYQIENPEGLYGNLSKYTKRTIPRTIPGRPFKNKATFEVEADDYNEYFMNQLFELLTEYGPVDEVWFDGAHPKTKGGQQYNYQAWKKLIAALAPKAVIFGKGDIRWCGNESGRTRATEWNVIPYQEDPELLNNFPDLTADIIGDRDRLYQAKFLHYQQAETNTSIREGWFYRDDTHQKVRSADDVFDIYERSVGGNSTFLLNIPPNREGKFSAADADVLSEVGRRINETYGKNIFVNASGPKQVLDASSSTSILLNNNDIIISTPSNATINRLILQEAITTNGERVEQHAVDAWVDGEWKEIASATNIGYKRILRFPEVTSNKFRIRVLQSRFVPAISNISAHYYRTRPPQVQFSRDLNGLIKISPFEQEFNWKPHGEHAAQNLNKDVDIFYTTDGNEPGDKSQKYTQPFEMGTGEVKALSVYQKDKGAVNSQKFGMLKKNWKLLEVGSETSNHGAVKAFDEMAKTYWQSKEGGANHISINLGEEANLQGFAYTPQTQNANGMMQSGTFQISMDGKTWRDFESFEFGNLINDPTRRIHYFKSPAKTRFIRIEPKQIASNGTTVAIAELDFFEQ